VINAMATFARANLAQLVVAIGSHDRAIGGDQYMHAIGLGDVNAEFGTTGDLLVPITR